MQTFLPYPKFFDSLDTLDKIRLNKQRVETFQLLDAFDKPSRWRNHPVFKMWSGHKEALQSYANKCIDVSDYLNINHSCKKFDVRDEIEMPWWFGNGLIHKSHQSNLVRKFPNHYVDIFPGVCGNMPYFWPVEIKCKKTGIYDKKSALWVKINSEEQREWYENYLSI